jgi:hypothetical protein
MKIPQARASNRPPMQGELLELPPERMKTYAPARNKIRTRSKGREWG